MKPVCLLLTVLRGQVQGRLGDVAQVRTKKTAALLSRNIDQGMYTLSLFTIIPHPRSSTITSKQNQNGFIFREAPCSSIPSRTEYITTRGPGLQTSKSVQADRCRHGKARARQSGRWTTRSSPPMGEELCCGQLGGQEGKKWKVPETWPSR